MNGDVYCDMDGVLVDFYAGVQHATGHRLENLKMGPVKEKVLKTVFDTSASFWANLPPTHDFHQLWGYIVRYQPRILTAVPHRHGRQGFLSAKVWDYALEGKWEWCQKYLHIPHNFFHLCHREDKQLYATSVKNGHVVSNLLIDDTADNVNQWIRNRGIGILHKNAADTIEQLRKHGL